MPIQDQMPRQEDDLLTRVAFLEKQLATVTGVAATAASIKQTIVTPLSAHNESNGFSLSTTPAELVRVTFTVPTGFTRALVFAAGGCSARNSNTGIDVRLEGYSDVNGGSATTPLQQSVIAQDWGAIFPATTTVISGLTAGSTFFCRIVGYVSVTSFAADATNRSTIDAYALFLS